MSAGERVYLDTSALAKWYLNEKGSEAFVEYIQGVDVAIISSLTQVEMRSLLARRRRMGELGAELESVIYSALLDDIAEGFLQRYAIENPRFEEAANLVARYPEHPLRALDALHLAVARHAAVDGLATADAVMAEAAASMGLPVSRF